jgi:hypothetical protein
VNECTSTHHIIALGIYLVLSETLEYWLGKTKRVEASSKLEIVIIGAGMVVGAVICVYQRIFKKGN